VSRYPFKSPVVVWLDASRPEFGAKHIEDVQEAIAALHRFGLGEFRQEDAKTPRSEWLQAASRLMRAKIDPTRDNIARGRDAFEKLAGAAGVLATRHSSGDARPLRRRFGSPHHRGE
jgi:hypothetical protein